MINVIWVFIILLGILWGGISGRLDQVTKALINSSDSAITLCISLAGIICFWSGLMKIIEKSGLLSSIASKSNLILKLLFPKIFNNSGVCGAIMMSFLANFLGLGNAATPLGIKAMKELQKIKVNKDGASDEMIMFIAINSSCIQLIPTTVIALREATGSLQSTSIIPAVWIASGISTLVSIMLVGVLRFSGTCPRTTR